MESLSETPWDVLIEGTGLQQSLLALALSRSDKKVLHVDQNDYYGGGEAAFSLQEVEEWIAKVNQDSVPLFRDASTWKADSDKLSFPRAYTLTLSPQIIYTRSKLLAQLVSSKVYKQLEFQAVGNWWIYDVSKSEESGKGMLRRLPNGREDIFQDDSIDNRAKRSLMKFLKFVIDYEDHQEVWKSHAKEPLSTFLSSKFQLPLELQNVIVALTLSLELPERTIVEHSLPRITRHLTSIGVFGPGFGAVFPKWGGGAEIAQVACRAGAVGGGTYILGTGVEDSSSYEASKQVKLSNGETITTKYFARDASSAVKSGLKVAVSKVVAVVSSPLASLFTSTVEGAPTSAVSIVAFPSGTLSIDGSAQRHPVYILVHSSETGECPVGQCILYCTTISSPVATVLMEMAINILLSSVKDGDAQVIYKLSYKQYADNPSDDDVGVAAQIPSLDLVFNDRIIDQVEATWKEIMGQEPGASATEFMKFEERKGLYDDDDDD